MKRCHFIKDDKTKEKILIPGCYSSLHQDDLSNCTCYTPKDFKKDTKPVRGAERALVYNADKNELRKHLVSLINLFRELEKKIN